jgi:hypothetical protein
MQFWKWKPVPSYAGELLMIIGLSIIALANAGGTASDEAPSQGLASPLQAPSEGKAAAAETCQR